MIDIHSHIIPELDDGSDNLDMSLILLSKAYSQGIRTFFATPHSVDFLKHPQRAKNAFLTLKAQAQRFFPDAQIHLGCEVKCDAADMAPVLDALAQGILPTMNGTSYVLMEFSHWVQPEATLPCITALVQAGWKPIIAHIERYAYLQGRMALIDQFRELGCRIQLNIYSLVEEGDPRIVQWARQLVLEKKVDFLGTDMHKTYDRPPSIQPGLDWICANCGQEFTDALAFGNAQNLL